jgi:hypothetical protein
MITERQKAFRQEYRSRIMGWYDGQRAQPSPIKERIGDELVRPPPCRRLALSASGAHVQPEAQAVLTVEPVDALLSGQPRMWAGEVCSRRASSRGRSGHARASGTRLVQGLIAQSPVEACDIGVLDRLARRDVVQATRLWSLQRRMAYPYAIILDNVFYVR